MSEIIQKSSYTFANPQEVQEILRQYFKSRLCKTHAAKIQEVNVHVDSLGGAVVQYVRKDIPDDRKD